MANIGQKIRKLRLERRLSQRELAETSGVSDAYVAMLESGKRKAASYEIVGKIAAALGVPASYFLEEDRPTTPKPLGVLLEEARRWYELLETIEVPLRGTVQTREPLMLKEKPEEYVPLSRVDLESIKRPYALKVSGTSLEYVGVHDGDLVVVDPDAPIQDGKVYVVRIGDECTAKRIYHHNDRLKLEGANGSYEIMEPRRVENLGRVVLAYRPPIKL